MHVVGQAWNEDPPAAKRRELLGPGAYSQPRTEGQAITALWSPAAPAALCSLVEVLLGSDLLLSMLQKDRERVLCSCLSCKETTEEVQGLTLALSAPDHLVRIRIQLLPSRLALPAHRQGQGRLTLGWRGRRAMSSQNLREKDQRPPSSP